MKLWRLYNCLITHLLNDYSYDFRKEIRAQLFYWMLKNTVAYTRTCFRMEWKRTNYSNQALTLCFNINMLPCFSETLFQKMSQVFIFYEMISLAMECLFLLLLRRALKLQIIIEIFHWCGCLATNFI